MGFDEIVMIVKVCVLGGLSIIGAKVAWTEREKIAALVSATWRRFVTVSFEDVVNRIEDSRPDYVDETEPVPHPDFAPQDDPSTALDGRSSQTRTTRADGEAWTAEEILRQLATIKRFDKDGTAVYLSKEKMAALVNMRAEEARVIINEARGETPPDALRVKDSAGERFIPRQVSGITKP